MFPLTMSWLEDMIYDPQLFDLSNCFHIPCNWQMYSCGLVWPTFVSALILYASGPE
jgi:hypothetical protein